MKSVKRIFLIACILILSTLTFWACKKQGTFVLNTPVNLQVTEDGYLTWDAVPYASSYRVIGDIEEYSAESNRFDIFELTDTPDVTYTFSVYAVGDKIIFEDSETSGEVSYRFDSCQGWEMVLINEEEEYEFRVTDPEQIKGKFAVPESYQGKPVTQLGGNCFANCKNMTACLLPDSLATVNGNVYCNFENCENLVRVKLSDEYELFAGNWFNNCNKLKEIVIPQQANQLLGMQALELATSPRVTLHPESSCLRMEQGCIIRNEDNCLLWGYQINAVPEGVEIIGAGVFKGRSIQHIALPDTLKQIEQEAFSESSLKKIVIPGSVESIGVSAFFNCNELNFVEIQEGVKSIQKLAFKDCKKLKIVHVPASVTEIDPTAFRGCVLGEMTISESNPNYSYEGYCLIQKGEAPTVITGFPNSVIPSGVQVIGKEAFFGADIRSVIIPEGVTTIGEYAFNSCPLVELCLPSTLQRIERSAFSSCTKLTFLAIPKGITYVGPSALELGKCHATFLVPHTALNRILDFGDNTTVFTDAVDLQTYQEHSYKKGIRSIYYGCKFGYDNNIPYVESVLAAFDSNGKSITIKAPESKNSIPFYGKMLAPYREGYTFAGWALEENGEVVIPAAIEKRTEFITYESFTDLPIYQDYVVNCCLSLDDLSIYKDRAPFYFYAVWVKN